MSLSSVITASVLLLVIMGIRCFFGKNMSKRVLYGLWLFAAVKLFVPLPVSNAFYLMNFFQTEENQVNLSGEDARSSGVSAVHSASNQNQTSAKRKEAAGTSVGNFSKTDEREMVSGKKNTKSVMTGGANEKETSENALIENGNRVEVYQAKETVKEKHGFLPGVSLKSVAYGIWICGMLILSAVLAINNVLFYVRLKSKRVLLEVYQNLPVYVSDRIESPCLFGFFSPAIYLPVRFWARGDDREEFDEENFRKRKNDKKYILLHEWTHFRHLDMLWSVVRCLCLVVWWFHPLVWVAFRMSVRDSELACDEGVILAIGEEEKKAYGYMLLHMCEGFGKPGNAVLPTLATEMTGGKGEMRDRIFTLTKGKKNSVLAGICALAVAVAACGCTYGKEGGKEIGKTMQGQENRIAKTKGMSGKNSAKQQNQKGYYQIHSEEEIKKDREEQVKLIHQNRNMWLIHTELDDRMMITGQAEREGDLTDLVYDKYAVSDMDQNGRLELIAFDNINGYAHFYEVEEDRSGLSECERAGDFDGAGNVGLLQNNGVFEDGTPGSYFDGEQGLWHFNLYTYDLFKKGDTVYLGGDETIGEGGEGAEYYKNMMPGCACFSWFKKTYMTSDGDGYLDKYYTEEELFKELEISADAFKLMKKETGPDYKQIYTEFARFKALSDSDGRDRWYMAIADSVQPVLILANGGYDKYPDLDRRYDELMTEADVYGYDLEKKEVVHVGTICGENLLFSLVTDGIYLEIERSTENTSERLYVMDGKGVLERVDGGRSAAVSAPISTHEKGHYSKIRLERAEGNGEDGEAPEVVLDQLEVPDYLAETLEFYPPYYMEVNMPRECGEVHFADVMGKPDQTLVFSKKKMGDYTVYITSDNAKKVTDELSPYHGLYEGVYQIEVYQGEELKDLRKIYIGGEDTLYFPKNFSLAVKDYNEDGNPDFALGNRVSSNHYEYMFYSISKWGLADYVLDAKSEPASVLDSSGKGPSGVFSSKDKMILYQWYDQEKGKNVKEKCELL